MSHFIQTSLENMKTVLNDHAERQEMHRKEKRLGKKGIINDDTKKGQV